MSIYILKKYKFIVKNINLYLKILIYIKKY